MLGKLRLKWTGSNTDDLDASSDNSQSSMDAWQVLKGSSLSQEPASVATDSANVVGTKTTETVTFAGSGLVFHNTYEPTVISAYRSAVLQAENFLQAHFVNPITVSIDFDTRPLSASSATNTFPYKLVSYAQLVTALRSHATTPDDRAAVASLPADDPSGGRGFELAWGLAGALGLGDPASMPLNDTVWLDSSAKWTYGQDAVGALEHEITEGVFGRIGLLGTNAHWAPLDLFRWSDPGVRDYTGGLDGKPAYFSVDGQTLLQRYHDSISATGFDGQDLGDWDGTAGDAFGPGGAGFPTAITPADLRVLDILGWTPSTTAVPRDFNGDARSDILWRNDDGAATVWDMSGTSTSGGADLGNPGPDWQPICTGDFSGNGNADILWQNTDGTAVIWRMNGIAVSGSQTFAPGPGWRAIGSGDFNGDGQSDILWQNTDGTPAIWQMAGNAISGSVFANPGTGWHAIGTGDFDGDGKSDLLWQNTDGEIAIWRMNGLSIAGGATIGNPGPSWHPISTGDFHGDGKSDILWQNADGQVVTWEMDGTSIAGSADFGNPGAEWHVIATGDYNGDSKSDIVWQRDDGAAAIWLMDGGSITANAGLGNPGASWHVVGNNRMTFVTDPAATSASRQAYPSAATAQAGTGATVQAGMGATVQAGMGATVQAGMGAAVQAGMAAAAQAGMGDNVSVADMLPRPVTSGLAADVPAVPSSGSSGAGPFAPIDPVAVPHRAHAATQGALGSG